jgi:hypothetical protein
MRSLGSHGLLDSVAIPHTTFGSGTTMELDIELQPGPQYRMGKLEIVRPPEVAEKLQARWELETRAVYDTTCENTFFEKNSSLLPADFIESRLRQAIQGRQKFDGIGSLPPDTGRTTRCLDLAKPVDCDR